MDVLIPLKSTIYHFSFLRNQHNFCQRPATNTGQLHISPTTDTPPPPRTDVILAKTFSSQTIGFRLFTMDPTTKVSPVETDSTTHTGSDGTKADANRPLPGGASVTLTELAKQNVAPFLAKYHPRQYAPRRAKDGTTSVPRTVNAGYCYRHQPDSKCSRQADEQSMHQLQRVRNSRRQRCLRR